MLNYKIKLSLNLSKYKKKNNSNKNNNNNKNNKIIKYNKIQEKILKTKKYYRCQAYQYNN